LLPNSNFPEIFTTTRNQPFQATRAQYRLASPKGTVAEYYDVVIVGSGYGGAVSAARFARSGLSVCVLEKGRELVPGDFPTSSAGVLTESIIRLHPDILSGGKVPCDLFFFCLKLEIRD
jgi:hypothetical protein